MMLNLVTTFRISSKSPQVKLSQGTKFDLKVSYHDNTGTEFTSGSAELRLRSTRFDLAHFQLRNDNISIVVSNKKSGATILKVWADGHHKTADYVKLSVKQTIDPVPVSKRFLCVLMWLLIFSLGSCHNRRHFLFVYSAKNESF